jgi:signal transduction histidine kinase
MGERALRPIAHLRSIVRQIVDRGSVDEETRSVIPAASLHQTDEVSTLAREFHQMATTLIEREKMIEYQKARLEEQNKTLMEMGELERRLQQAEHLAVVGRMSAQVAHEVGNPLHSIGLEAEHALAVLAAVESSSSKSAIALKQSLQSIEGNVERLQKIIQNYLKLTRLTPGLRKAVDLKEIVEAALATYANAFQAQGVRVSWHFDPALSTGARVEADAELLEFALGNLIRNSLQALEKTPPGHRSIAILLEPAATGAIRLGFSDTGPGIPEEMRSNLFKPFFTTKAQGTGLGLSFVKKVFTDLGGDFRLVRGQDRGAFFEGELPVLTLHATSAPENRA